MLLYKNIYFVDKEKKVWYTLLNPKKKEGLYMKKVVCFALACLLLFGIAGCTSEKTNDSTDSTDSTDSMVSPSDSSVESTISSTDTASISQGEVSSEASTDSESTSKETSAVPKPIDNTGVPEEFWECENVVADLESFAVDDPWNDMYDACGEMRGRAYSFLNIYLSGDKSKASLLVDVDDACLARIPEGGSAYGSFDDMEHFYFKDLRCFYGVDRKTDRAWMKTVFALKGQFYELTLSLETKESANQWNVYSSWWSIVDFEVVETEIDPAELQTDVVALQDLAFRYFKAYCHGDGKAAKPMVADPDDTEQNALAYCEKKYVSLQDTTFHVGILIDDQNRIEVDITFSDEEDLKAWYMVLCLTAEEVKDDAENMIDRVWKITDCGIDA